MTRKSIVVGYDGSPEGLSALEWSLDSARLRRLPVIAVHASAPAIPPLAAGGGYWRVDEAKLREAGERVLAEATRHAAAHAPEVEFSSQLVAAPAVAALMDASAGAELLVVGARGMDGFTQLLVGSTSVQLAAHGACPTVVVRPQAAEAATPGPEAGRVVVGVDGSAVSESAVAFAFEEASLRGVGLTAVHAWDAGFLDLPGKAFPTAARAETDSFMQEEVRLLSESLAGWREKFPDVDVRQDVCNGRPAFELIAASSGAALLVVGSRGRGGFMSLLLGSVSHAVLHHAHCPVAVAR